MRSQVSAAAACLFIFVLLCELQPRVHVRAGAPDPMLEFFPLLMIPWVICPVLAIGAIVHEPKSLRVAFAAAAVFVGWMIYPGTMGMFGFIRALADGSLS
jgi:hypothetical protein